MYKTAARAALIANSSLLHAYSLKAAALRLRAQTKKLRHVSHHSTGKHQCTRLESVPNLNSQAISPISEG